jgi:hypothetical protein
MTLKETSATRPDGTLLVIAYLLTLGAGFLLGGLTLLVTALPQSLQMAQGDSLFVGGAAVLLFLTIACLLFGGWLLVVARRLWSARPNSRPAAAVTLAVLAMMALLSIPTFFIAYDGGSFLLASVAGAALLAALSAACYWYLTRPHVKSYFG